MHGGKPEHRVLDIVAGKNGDRALGAKSAREQRRRERAHGGERVSVAHRAPGAAGIALREEGPVRGRFRPVG